MSKRSSSAISDTAKKAGGSKKAGGNKKAKVSKASEDDWVCDASMVEAVSDDDDKPDYVTRELSFDGPGGAMGFKVTASGKVGSGFVAKEEPKVEAKEPEEEPESEEDEDAMMAEEEADEEAYALERIFSNPIVLRTSTNSVSMSVPYEVVGGGKFGASVFPHRLGSSGMGTDWIADDGREAKFQVKTNPNAQVTKIHFIMTPSAPTISKAPKGDKKVKAEDERFVKHRALIAEALVGVNLIVERVADCAVTVVLPSQFNGQNVSVRWQAEELLDTSGGWCEASEGNLGVVVHGDGTSTPAMLQMFFSRL